MPQTLLAFGGMLVAVLISLTVQHSTLFSRLNMLSIEASTQATGLATNMLDQAGRLEFDRSLLTGAAIKNISDLTLPNHFGGGRIFEEAQAIEDLHNIQPYVRTIQDMEFTVRSSVQYVNMNTLMPVGNARTFAKEVTLVIENPNLRSPVTISRVYTYQPF